ncbi:hypothetical protein ACFL9T_04660 [Thermodesulfobacteriota bacterium]
MKTYITLILLSYVVAGCTGTDDFSRKLSEEVGRGPGTIIRFAELTKFSWDKVHVYGPYHPLDEINAKHHISLKGEYGFNHVPEGDCLYVFVLEDKTVESIFCPRSKGSCHEILKPGVFTPESAEFEVKVKTSGPHPYLIKIDYKPPLS